MFNVKVDSPEKKEIHLEQGWMIKDGYTNCPKHIYDSFNEDTLDEYWSSLEEE